MSPRYALLEAMEHSKHFWYVMRVTYQRELQAQKQFDSLNIVSYVPMKTVHDGRKLSNEVVLHNYIFVYSSFDELLEIKNTKIKFLRYTMTRCETGEPIPMTVPSYQMENFMKITNSGSDAIEFFNPDDLDLQDTENVVVTDGEFEGVEGQYIKRRVVAHLVSLVGVSTSIIPKKYIKKL